MPVEVSAETLRDITIGVAGALLAFAFYKDWIVAGTRYRRKVAELERNTDITERLAEALEGKLPRGRRQRNAESAD